MKNFYFTALMFAAFVTQAQQTEFAPIGAYWRYSWFSMLGDGFAVYRVAGDTLIQGKRFKKIDYQSAANRWADPFSSPFQRATYYLTVKEDSVFFGGLSNMRFLYNFQMNAPDSILVATTYFTNPSLARAVVDSVRPRYFVDSTRRMVFFSRYCRRSSRPFRYSDDQLIENVGLLKEGLFWIMQDCNVIEEYYPHFECYRAGNFGYPANVTCPATVGSENELTLRQQIQLHPNPAQTEIRVHLPDVPLVKAQITNLLGQSCPISMTNGVLDVSNLPNGGYYLTLTFNLGEHIPITRPFFVQH